MGLKKFLSIFILISLFLIPPGKPGDVRIVKAQDDQPAGQESDERLDQEVADPNLFPKASTTEAPHDISFMLGTDPYQGALSGSHLVEVVIPVSKPPEERKATFAAPYQERPETSYFIEQTVNMVPGPDVLLLEADSDTPTDSPILSLLQMYGDLGEVNMFDAETATPTLSQLLPYNVVVTWSNSYYADPVGIGNVLADYVDAGGKVVNLVFSLSTSSYQMQGRFMTGGYTAMNGTDLFLLGTHCLGSTNPAHPIMFGITDVCDSWGIVGTTLTSGSSSIAQWDDGLIFVAAKNDRSVVSINGWVGQIFRWTGQMPDVLHNTILWLADDGGCNTVLYNNGPLITKIASGYEGANVSELQAALGLNIFGFGNQFKEGNRIADDFTVSSPQGWQVEQLTFYAYQTDTYTYPPSSTITGIYYQIWDGPPDDPASQLVFGDLTTNRLLESSWTHSYRVTDDDLSVNTRPIMANAASAGVFLPQGTYWLDWMTDGTGTSGPWAPPITIPGLTTTGNALQYTTTTTAWDPVIDTGLGTQQGLPFLVQGCKEETAWQEINANPVRLKDIVLAAHNDKIWSITGYGDAAGVINYDPVTGIWAKIASSAPPFGINYARSGCQVGSSVYMYGDTETSGFTGLWRYDMNANTWTQLTPGNPGYKPATAGIWAPAWVLDSATNRCYLTGGATAPGGGDLSTVYVYEVGTNKWLPPLPSFTSPRDFHAAYLFTRPTDSHKLMCVAGGADSVDNALSTTQCYDFTTSSWHPENSDLGALPMAVWGSGYTQSPTLNGLNLWLVSGNTIPIINQTWMFNVRSNSWIAIGPLESGQFYRTSAVVLNGMVYHIGGGVGLWSYSGLSDRYVGSKTYLPLMMK